MKSSRLLILYIFLLIVISFSPLLNQYTIIIILFFLIIFNISGVTITKNIASLLSFSIIFIFIINAILDIKNANTLIDYSPLNIYYPLTFVFGYLFSKQNDISDYLLCIHKILFPIAILSLLGVIVYSFLPNIVAKLPSYTYYHTTHKTAIIFNILLDQGVIIKRNAGIAWEPGAFQFLLNIGLFSYFLFNKGKISLFVLLIYISAIFFTRSTTGLIILLIQFLRIVQTNKKARFILILVVILFLTNIISEVSYHANHKLIGSYSFMVRFNPMIEAYQNGGKYLFGLGNTGYNHLLDNVPVNSYDSYSQIVVRYGYILLILICFSLFRILKYDITLFLILFLSLLGETMWFFPFVTPFYFFIYKRKNVVLYNHVRN